MIRIYNRHLDVVPPGAVYVGRGTPWGNPYSHRPHRGTLPALSVWHAVMAYRQWLHAPEQEALLARVQPELGGRDLVCSCRPADGFQGRLLCHAQILGGLANHLDPESIP